MHNNANKQILPGLSIIRTLAAFSVLFGHFYQFGSWNIVDSNRAWLPEIYLPVTTFFVISGFLITLGLLREQDRTGYVNIGKAYQRRAIRLLPTYYIGIAIGLLALWGFNGSIEGTYALLFCLLPNLSHALGSTPFPFWHYWTLGTEIMFYLWFPWVIKYFRKYLLQIVITICALWLSLKWGSYIFLGKVFFYRFVCITQFETIMLGSIGCILFYEQKEWLFRICSTKWFAIISWALFLSSNLWCPLLPSPVSSDAIAIVSIMTILSAFCGKPILENKLTQYFGKISYGIYIFHPIIIYAVAEVCTHLCIPTTFVWIEYLKVLVVILFTIGFATLTSYIDSLISNHLKK